MILTVQNKTYQQRIAISGLFNSLKIEMFKSKISFKTDQGRFAHAINGLFKVG